MEENMIIICPKSKKCQSYARRKEPCWTESTKGQVIWCNEYEEKEGNKMTNRTVYCPTCQTYGMESEKEDIAVCPDCGGTAQWEDEVLKYRRKI
jgi:hypothetical protein